MKCLEISSNDMLCIIYHLNQFGAHIGVEFITALANGFLCIKGMNKIGGNAEYGEIAFCNSYDGRICVDTERLPGVLEPCDLPSCLLRTCDLLATYMLQEACYLMYIALLYHTFELNHASVSSSGSSSVRHHVHTYVSA